MGRLVTQIAVLSSAADTAKALFDQGGIDLSATDVAKILYKGAGLDLSFDRTVDAIVDAGIRSYKDALKLVTSIR